MKIIKIIGITILSIIAIILLIPMFLSTSFSVSRSVEIDAPKDSVYAYLSDFNNFPQWSPWARIEQGELNYKVVGSGIGSTFSWEGIQTGKGKMTLIGLEPNVIKAKMSFIAPWEAEADVQWTVEPAGNKTKVTWTYSQGHLKYFQRYFNLTADKMLGGAFDQGFKFMKEGVEKK
jgi:carbon monoxide dehydrogenase subunit G